MGSLEVITQVDGDTNKWCGSGDPPTPVKGLVGRHVGPLGSFGQVDAPGPGAKLGDWGD